MRRWLLVFAALSLSGCGSVATRVPPPGATESRESGVSLFPADAATLSARVTGGQGNTLVVIKNGAVEARVDIDSDPFTHQTEVVAPETGEDRYRHEVVFGESPATLSSYVWLRAADEAPDGGTTSSSSSGCNCRVATPQGADSAALLLVALMLSWWKRRRAR